MNQCKIRTMDCECLGSSTVLRYLHDSPLMKKSRSANSGYCLKNSTSASKLSFALSTIACEFNT